MRRRALLATQSNINPEFVFEWHLRYSGGGSINIHANNDENVVKAFDTLVRIHEALGDGLNYGEIPREYNITVNGVRLTSSYYYDTDAQIITTFESASNTPVYFGNMTRDMFMASHI